MAILQNRKRQRANEALQDGRCANYPDPWRYPPEFWDRLSTIPLIRSALEELDRRICKQPAPPPSSPTEPAARDLARFAHHGGPDLRDLRGYPAPALSRHHTAGTMSSSSSAQNPGFEQHLANHGIHATWSSQKPDLTEIKAALANPRPSLSPSRFPDDAFETFQNDNARAKDESDVCKYVLPVIAGPWKDNYPSAENMAFLNLEPLTDGTIAAAKPDIALGARPEQLNPDIRRELQYHIVPSTSTDRIIAPNFFLEAKGPDGSAAVMMRQARYNGAVGARAMHSLQNYDREELVYDGNAYTYTTTYHGGTGTLQLYAHHATAPATPEGQPEFHMNQLRGFIMTDTRERFVEGATAYRNLRDLAKKHRDAFIQDANARYQAAQENPIAEA
ncbi:hypothetical protein M406DRAFT_336294 [Cryphonectria parasitica EP155]|uniref:DUF7924 domain-containing protein n=1 Tax=Cryphonectria parasitica (strain ATCC 38755 / EP155) TaxID=660469 RepID=A0A9P4YCS5_CRYP1|nr:uncharacterized protein M406DRAFT_336294 [Cryphonectria parasitica EP155]KAF3770680.1 hypothetical protein M406DRAFT_336294 [Cryphonectria parasitica EP155]